MTSEIINLSGSFDESFSGSVSCKFVILGHDAHYLLVFGSLDQYAYHANLLDKFFKDRQIAARWVKHPDQLQVDDPHYRVLGGGYLEVDAARRKVRVHGSSKAYGFFDSEAVRLVMSRASFFHEWTVQIES